MTNPNPPVPPVADIGEEAADNEEICDDCELPMMICVCDELEEERHEQL